MTTVVLLNGVTAAQSAPTFTKPPAVVFTPGGGANTPGAPPVNQSFQMVISSATSGLGGAAVHIVGSNDYNPANNTGNWVDYPSISPFGVSNLGLPNVSVTSGSIAFNSFGAWVGTVTGTNVAVTLTMNC